VTTEEARPKKKSKKEKEEPYVCGHVVCKSCADSIVKESGRCCVCEASIGEDGMIPLGKEGTGFAAAGGAEVKRNVTTFRV
jgi:nitric oxide synthase-interacting protein